MILTWTRRTQQGMKQATDGGHTYTAWLVEGRWHLDRDGFPLAILGTWAEVEKRVAEDRL